MDETTRRRATEYLSYEFTFAGEDKLDAVNRTAQRLGFEEGSPEWEELWDMATDFM